MTTASVIGPGTAVRGGVRGDGDLEIQGRVEGTVVVNGEVIVAEGALVKSDIRARRVIVRGNVRGSVSADELLILELTPEEALKLIVSAGIAVPAAEQLAARTATQPERNSATAPSRSNR